MVKSGIGLLAVGLAASALAVDKAQLDQRLQNLTDKFEGLQSKLSIAAESLRKAHGIILLERTKAGFLFGYQGGGGVALIRDVNTGEWSAPAFLRARGASFGFQAGRQQSFVVILLMNEALNQALTDPEYQTSEETKALASVRDGGKAEASASAPAVLIFGDRRGVFGGVATKGGAIVPDHEANRAYYGHSVSMDEILVKRSVDATESASRLAELLSPSTETASR